MRLTDLYTNPYAPPESISARELKIQRRLRTKTTLAIRTLSVLLCGAIPVVLWLMANKIESIIGSGPIVSILGVFLGVAGIKPRNFLAMLTGYSVPIFSLFIFALINIFEWSPEDADSPVQLMSWAYALITGPLLFWVAVRPAISSRANENDSEPIEAASN